MLGGTLLPDGPPPPLRPSLAHRLLLALLPALVIASIAASTLWGTNGLVARYHLQRDLDDATGRLAAIDRENQRLVRELDRMDADPMILERMVAEELGWGRPGTVLYRFEPAEPCPTPDTCAATTAARLDGAAIATGLD